MKKIFFIFLAVLTLTAWTACGGMEDVSSGKESVPEGEGIQEAETIQKAENGVSLSKEAEPEVVDNDCKDEIAAISHMKTEEQARTVAETVVFCKMG